jgi:hypothetical protein
MTGEEQINGKSDHSHGHGHGHVNGVGTVVGAPNAAAHGRPGRVIIPAPKNELTRDDRKPRIPRQCRTCGGAYRQSCHVHAIRSFINAFCLSYGIRATVAILFRGIQLFRKSPKSFFNIKELVCCYLFIGLCLLLLNHSHVVIYDIRQVAMQRFKKTVSDWECLPDHL